MSGPPGGRSHARALWLLPGCVICLAGISLLVTNCAESVVASFSGKRATSGFRWGESALLAGIVWLVVGLLYWWGAKRAVPKPGAAALSTEPGVVWAYERGGLRSSPLLPGFLATMFGLALMVLCMHAPLPPDGIVGPLCFVAAFLVLLGGLAWFAHGVDRSSARSAARATRRASPGSEG